MQTATRANGTSVRTSRRIIRRRSGFGASRGRTGEKDTREESGPEAESRGNAESDTEPGTNQRPSRSRPERAA